MKKAIIFALGCLIALAITGVLIATQDASDSAPIAPVTPSPQASTTKPVITGSYCSDNNAKATSTGGANVRCYRLGNDKRLRWHVEEN